MKKVFLIGILSFWALTSASAQVSFGPRIGVNFANVTASDGINNYAEYFNDNSSARTGLLAGVAAKFAVNEVFSVQPEILFSQQGYTLKYEAISEGFRMDAERTLTANYLHIPVLLNATFGNGDFKVISGIGPYAGYWLSGKDKYTGPGPTDGIITVENKIEFDKKKDREDYNRLDAGICANIGVGYTAGPGTITLDVRYNFGLANTVTPTNFDKKKLTNRYPGISLSYMFAGK